MPTLYWGPWLAKICRGGPGWSSLMVECKHVSENYYVDSKIEEGLANMFEIEA
jgi:hypothetical protein